MLVIPHLLRSSLSALLALIASLPPRYMRKNGLQPTKREHVTSYLDALRGWAAFIVLTHHHHPYMPGPIRNLPVLSILNAGRGMVDVFFVISGYVLSYRMIKLMRTQQAVTLLDTVISSVFRRYTRLFGSAAFASFICMITVVLGWSFHGLKKPTLGAQIWDWMKGFLRFSNIFSAEISGYWTKGGFSDKYLDVLWTIPVEFRGSMVVYAFGIGCCKLSSRNRMLLCCFMILLCYCWAVFYVALFLTGFLLADLQFSRHPERVQPAVLPQSCGGEKTATSPLSWVQKVTYSFTCFWGIILVTQPGGRPQTAFWPWPFLDRMTPSSYNGIPARDHFWLSIGAILLVFSLDSYPALQRPLKWNFSRYLGDLSFGIYVTHVPVVVTLWANVLNPMRRDLLGDALWTNIPVSLFVYAVVLWAADLFIRVDDKVIAGGKWLQGRLFTW